MSTTPSSTPVAAVYSHPSLVGVYLLPNTIGEGARNAVTPAVVDQLILRFSRQLDGVLGGRDWRVPFPGYGSTAPGTPEPAKWWVTLRAAAECALISAAMNRQAPQVVELHALAGEILTVERDGSLTGTLPADSFNEHVSNEEFAQNTLDSGGLEYGQLGNTGYYRLRNRGLIVDGNHPLTFRNAAGTELVDSAGFPYSYGRDWVVINAGASLIRILNRTNIEAAASGIDYWFSWRNPCWGENDMSPYGGVDYKELGT